MRKRWEFNGDAWAGLAIGWFVAGMVLAIATMDQGDPKVHGDGDMRWWAALLWLGPYGLLLLGAALYGLWGWLTSENGWFLRRTQEPVHEDLRAAGK